MAEAAPRAAGATGAADAAAPAAAAPAAAAAAATADFIPAPRAVAEGEGHKFYSAAIFRRGQKAELFAGGTEAGTDEHAELARKLADLHGVWALPRAGRDLSAAIWRPALGAAEVVLQRGKLLAHMGFTRGGRVHLFPEEAAYLVDRASLLLFVDACAPPRRRRKKYEDSAGGEEEGEAGGKEEQGGGASGSGSKPSASAAAAGAAGAAATAGATHGGKRLLSLREAEELLAAAGVPHDAYLVYCKLARAGLIAQRAPARWALRPAERPQDVWPRWYPAAAGGAAAAAGGADGAEPAAKRPRAAAPAAPAPRPPPTAAEYPNLRPLRPISAAALAAAAAAAGPPPPAFDVSAPNPRFSRRAPDAPLFRVACVPGLGAPPLGALAAADAAAAGVPVRYASVRAGDVGLYALAALEVRPILRRR
jgi:hypothetical protein